jgi:hypothetical protein
MANAKIAPSIPFSSPIAETITEAKQLVASDSGKQFFVAQGTGAYVINLPKLSSSIAGWNAEFILTTVGDAVEVNCYGVPQGGVAAAGSTTDDSDLMYSVEIGHTEAVAPTTDGISFGASATSLGARIQVSTNGTSWYAMGFGGIADDIVDLDTD